jgi:gas vesicle protein
MTKDSCLWFTYGIAIGAAAGILLAPRSGMQTREAIASEAKRRQALLKEQAAEVSSALAGKLERSRETMKKTAESVKAAVDAGRKAFAG